MYLTDEFMDQYAAEVQIEQERLAAEDTEVADDLELQQREEDYRLANCHHENTGPEPMTPDPDGPQAVVCYDCNLRLGQAW
jgi:hypothetical protein